MIVAEGVLGSRIVMRRVCQALKLACGKGERGVVGRWGRQLLMLAHAKLAGACGATHAHPYKVSGCVWGNRSCLPIQGSRVRVRQAPPSFGDLWWKCSLEGIRRGASLSKHFPTLHIQDFKYARTRAYVCARALSPSLTAPHERSPPNEFRPIAHFKVIENVILVDFAPVFPLRAPFSLPSLVPVGEMGFRG